jgi:GntR family transcriptional regulator
MRADTRPVACLIDTLPDSVLQIPSLPSGFHGSVLDFLIERGDDLRISRAAISATNATAEIAKALEIQRGDVLLRFISQLYTGDGRIADYTVSYFIPGYFNFHVVRRIGNAGQL